MSNQGRQLHAVSAWVMLCRSTSELGGLWPGANVPRYGQQRLHGQLILPVTDSAAVALTAEAGLLLPLAARPSSQTTCISDRSALLGLPHPWAWKHRDWPLSLALHAISISPRSSFAQAEDVKALQGLHLLVAWA